MSRSVDIHRPRLLAGATAFALAAAIALGGTTLAAAALADTPTVASVSVGSQPNAVAFTSDDSTAWVADFGSDQVSPVTGGIPGAPITVGDGPFGIAASPNGATIYATNYLDGTVSVIDRSTRAVTQRFDVGNFPAGIVVSPDGARLYVANLGTDTISVLSTSDLSELAVIPVGDEPWGLAITPDGSALAVTDSATTEPGVLGAVNLIDTSTLTLTATITVGNNPTGITISNDGTTAYVANTDDGTLSVIDLSSAAVTQTVPLGGGVNPMGLDLAINEHALYVTDANGDSLLLVDPQSYVVLAQTVTVGAQPRAVTVGADGKTAYVTNYGSNTLSIVAWAQPQRAPGAPTGVTATAAIESAIVTWTAPADPGTAPISSYTVTAVPGGQTCSSAVGSALSCQVRGLTAGISRTFTVTASNAVGTSDPSSPSNAVVPLPQPGPGPTPNTKPTVPTNVSALAGIEAADVSWTPSANPGSSPLRRYVVTAIPSGNTCEALASSAPSCTVEDLNPGVPVRFTVVAYNATDASDPSAPSNSVTPQAHPGAPSPPRDLQASLTGPSDLSITATWSAPSDDGHTPITGYEAVARTDDGSAWHTCETSGALTCLITGLAPGETYRVFVTADNSQGTSGPSDLSEPIYVTQQGLIAHVSSSVAAQSYQRVLADAGAPAATMKSSTASTCLVQGQRVVFIANGSCTVKVSQKGFDPRTITTKVGGSSAGTATLLTLNATVVFDKGSSTLSSKARQTLKGAAAQLKKAGTVTVVASAPTTGLAKQRAKSIAAYLKDLSVKVTAKSSTVSSKSPNKGFVRSAP